jgi:cbb3-type cytochrome oxidase maturation protein
MSILFVLIPLSLALVVFGGWAFFWAVNAGQFDDLDSPGWEVLREDAAETAASEADGG